jgi:hypothetical protein
MARLTILTLLVVSFAVFSPAQVTVTNQGFATTPGPAVPAIPYSPPILFAPIVRFDQGQTQPMEAVATAPEQSNTTSTGGPIRAQSQPFNFGVAQFDSRGMNGGVGQAVDGKSLGDFARELRQKSNTNTNARTYTNSDVERVSQGGGVTGSAVQSNRPDNWTPNNGVINPQGQVAEPTVTSPSPAPAPNAPFSGPKAQPSQNSPSPSPRSALQPSESERPAVVQASLKQSENAGNPVADTQLPATATQLPLLGLLGFFSVVAGVFVRHQRSKNR